jgi:hypothetical protein
MADEPERLMAGALLKDLEAQAAETPGLTVGPPDSAGMVYIEGLVDIHLLARAAQEEAAEDQARADAEAERGRQRIELTEVEPTTWYVPMRSRNLSSARWEFVQVEAPTAEEAISKAISAKPGHTWRSPTRVED